MRFQGPPGTPYRPPNERKRLMPDAPPAPPLDRAGVRSGARQFAPRGPAEVGRFLDVKAQELDQLENQVQEAHETLEDAELEWEKHYDEILTQLEEERGKIPGEDMRISIARRRDGWQKWTNYRRADRSVKRLEKQATIAANVISACQSEAKLLAAR